MTLFFTILAFLMFRDDTDIGLDSNIVVGQDGRVKKSLENSVKTIVWSSVWKSGPVQFFGQISTDRNRNRLPIMARPQITGPDHK